MNHRYLLLSCLINIFSRGIIERRIFVHKNCWKFGQCCALEASNEQSATAATGVEVSMNADRDDNKFGRRIDADWNVGLL